MFIRCPYCNKPMVFHTSDEKNGSRRKVREKDRLAFRKRQRKQSSLSLKNRFSQDVDGNLKFGFFQPEGKEYRNHNEGKMVRCSTQINTKANNAFDQELPAQKSKIHWFQEIRIAFLTSVLFLIFTTSVLWVAQVFSPGEYSGERLRQYLLVKLANKLEVSPTEEALVIEQQVEATSSKSLQSDTIILCGTYRSDSDQIKFGRYISIWERKDQSFWNELFGTDAPYEIKFLQVLSSKQEYGVMECANCDFVDLNSDGADELHISYRSHFADRTATADVFLTHCDNGWNIISSDLSGVENEILDQLEGNGYILLDEFNFCSIDQFSTNTTVYSLALYGQLLQIINPIWGDYNFLYYIAVNNGTDLMHTDHFAIVMMRLSDENKMVRDPNWNSGKVYVGKCEKVDLEQIIDERWGYQTGGLIFYGDDIT